MGFSEDITGTFGVSSRACTFDRLGDGKIGGFGRNQARGQLHWEEGFWRYFINFLIFFGLFESDIFSIVM